MPAAAAFAAAVGEIRADLVNKVVHVVISRGLCKAVGWGEVQKPAHGPCTLDSIFARGTEWHDGDECFCGSQLGCAAWMPHAAFLVSALEAVFALLGRKLEVLGRRVMKVHAVRSVAGILIGAKLVDRRSRHDFGK